MKGFKPFLYLLLGCLVCAIVSGCAGSVPQSGPGALLIAQIPLAQGVPGLSYRQLLVASGGTQPYTWSVSDGTLPPGLSIDTNGIISGTPTMTGTFNFTVKVVDSQTPTAAVQTQPFSIMINPVLSLASTPLASGLVGNPYSAGLVAANGVQPYTYVVAFGSLPGGLTLTTNMPPMGGGPNTATISGTPTDAGVFNFTIEASDQLGEVATAAFSITITGRLQGNYTMTFNGYANNQPFYFVSSFVADGNGNITSGVIDQAGPGAGTSPNVPLMPSTYTLPLGSTIANMHLISSVGNYAFSIVLSSTGDSQVLMTNASRYGSGVLKKQSTFALPPNVASYAFGLFGSDTGGNPYAGAGMFQTSSLSITAGVEDTNDNGTASGELSITGGSVTNPDPSTGRGTLSLDVNGQTYNYAYYTTSMLMPQLLAIATDANAPQTLVTVLPQASGGITGSFSNNSLTCQGPGACSVIQLNGLTSAGPDVSVGAVTFDGMGNLTRQGIDSLPGYFTDENNAGTASQNSYGGTYNVDATCGTISSACGRVTVTLTDNGQPIDHQPVWYLVSKNEGFVVGTDPAATSGQFLPQTGGPFTIASILGAYLGGTLTPVSQSVTNEIDVAGTPPPGGIWTSSYYTNGPGGPQGAQRFAGTYAFDSTYGRAFGRFTVTTNSGQPVLVLYVAGTGSAGATGNKAGLLGINVGQYDGTADPNPRLSVYSR